MSFRNQQLNISTESPSAELHSTGQWGSKHKAERHYLLKLHGLQDLSNQISIYHPSLGKRTILLEILWWQNEIGSVFLVATEKHTFQYNLSQNTRIRALVWITVSGRWTYIVSALKEWCFSLLELKSNFGRVQQMI